jgi:hypothetical protein
MKTWTGKDMGYGILNSDYEENFKKIQANVKTLQETLN